MGNYGQRIPLLHQPPQLISVSGGGSPSGPDSPYVDLLFNNATSGVSPDAKGVAPVTLGTNTTIESASYCQVGVDINNVGSYGDDGTNFDTLASFTDYWFGDIDSIVANRHLIGLGNTALVGDTARMAYSVNLPNTTTIEVDMSDGSTRASYTLSGAISTGTTMLLAIAHDRAGQILDIVTTTDGITWNSVQHTSTLQVQPVSGAILGTSFRSGNSSAKAIVSKHRRRIVYDGYKNQSHHQALWDHGAEGAAL